MRQPVGLRRRAGAVALTAVALLCLAATAADPLVVRQYHLDTVRAFEAWDRSRGEDVVVAVVDTGVHADHPDLRGRLVEGIDLVEPGTPPDDPNGHGTLVAGVIAATADNGEGGAGAAPAAKVMPVRVLDARGRGTSDVVAEGIDWAVEHGADVINLSLADVPGQQRPPSALITTDVEEAITRADEAGVLVVAAAGNEGEESTPYAESVPLLVVGATDADDVVWPRSNRSDDTLFAPGVGIVSTYLDGGYAEAAGTSFAAPIVSAAAAVLYDQVDTPAGLRRRLTTTAAPVGAGLGRVDLAAAVQARDPIRASPPARPSAPPPAAPPAAPPEQGDASGDAVPLEPVIVVPSPAPSPPRPTIEATPRATPAPVPTSALDPALEPLFLPPPVPAPPPLVATAPTVAPDETEAAAPAVAGAAEQAAPASRTLWLLGVAGGLLLADLVGVAAYARARRGHAKRVR